jgi:hypothetical protein
MVFPDVFQNSIHLLQWLYERDFGEMTIFSHQKSQLQQEDLSRVLSPQALLGVTRTNRRYLIYAGVSANTIDFLTVQL